MPKKDSQTKQAEKKARTAAKQEKKSKKSTAKAGKKNKDVDIDSSDDESVDLDAVLASYAKQQEQFLAITETSCDPPSARSSATLLASPQNEREVLLFGGELYDGQLARFYNELFVYNTKRGTWVLVTSPNSPLPRSGHSWCIHQNSKRVYLFGGEFSSPKQGTFYHYADLWMLEPSSREWTKLDPKGKPPSARSGHRMVSWRQYVVLFGGFRDTSDGTTYLNDVFLYDTNNSTWFNPVSPPGNQRPEPRSSLSLLPHEGGAALYGGYSRVKVMSKAKSGAAKAVEKPVVHGDTWLLRITAATSPSEKDGPSIRWEKRKRPANAPNPPKAGATMASHKGRGIAFGGVWDTEGSEERIDSEFFNELGVWNVERNRCFKLSLRRPKARKQVLETDRGGRGARSKQGEDELLARLQELEAKDTGARAEEVIVNAPEELDARENDGTVERPVQWEMPYPRFNAQLAVQDDVCYIYGGTYEKGDREFTFDEMWAIDLGRLDGCKEIFKRELPNWNTEDEGEEDEDSEGDVEEMDVDDESEDTKSAASTLVADDSTLAGSSPSSTQTELADDHSVALSPFEDTSPHPRPFESLRAFYNRTSEAWQVFLLEESDEGADLANKSIKQVRKGAFERAEEKWWDCREEIQALEDEQEEAGIGEVVNLKEKQASTLPGGAGRRR